MTITFKTGNIFHSTCDAIVNPVNCYGVSGKGLALEFKYRFPDNYEDYRTICVMKEFNLGDVFITEDVTERGMVRIVNLPTKRHWRDRSSYHAIDKGLVTMCETLHKEYPSVKSVAIPALGCGCGGLDWDHVKRNMIQVLADKDFEFEIYEPGL